MTIAELWSALQEHWLVFLFLFSVFYFVVTLLLGLTAWARNQMRAARKK